MFKDEIRTRRHALGMSQMQLAKALGIPSHRTVQNWEYNKTIPPKWVQRLILIALDNMLK